MDRIAIFALASAMGLVASAAEIGGMQVIFVQDGEVRGSFVNRTTYYKPWDVDGEAYQVGFVDASSRPENCCVHVCSIVSPPPLVSPLQRGGVEGAGCAE